MSAALVALFAPYCQGAARPGQLELALELLQHNQLQGLRRLRPAGERHFLLRWQAGVAPLEPAEVALEVSSGQAGTEPALYSFALPTHQLVRWLMDWLEAGGGPQQPADLPESFWQWLILGIDPTAART
jgi:hypothetical protein